MEKKSTKIEVSNVHLYEACQNGNIIDVEKMLENNELNWQNAKEIAAICQQSHIIELINKNKKTEKTLYYKK